MEIISLPIFIAKEGKWFVACCPLLEIATQGKTEAEVKENMKDLIDEYMNDPDTAKPGLENIMSASVTMTTIPVRLEGVTYNATTVSK